MLYYFRGKKRGDQGSPLLIYIQDLKNKKKILNQKEFFLQVLNIV